MPDNRKEANEDLLSTLALGKTLVFILYSLPALLLSFVFFLAIAKKLTPLEYREEVFLIFFIGFEIILLLLVIYDLMPGAKRSHIAPISEKTATNAVAALSFSPWIFFNDPELFNFMMDYFNVALIAIVLVYFFTKSFLSKTIRFKILGLIVIPSVHIIFF